MSWQYFFEHINNLSLFSNCINNNLDYIQDEVKCIFSLDKKSLKNFHYNSRSKKYYSITIDNETLSIDKTFLLLFYKDYLKKVDFSKSNPFLKFKYFDFEFMLNLTLSRDALSGLENYRRMLQTLVREIEHTPITIQGSPLIKTTTDLDLFLQKNMLNFSSLNNELKFH